ncbi:MAG: STAS domain-containing protein [candidate division KSB1 bacterium]
MLRVRKSLLASAPKAEALQPELRPFATAEIAVRKNQGTITIILEGVILGESAKELQTFLRDVASFRATHWSVRMAALRVMSANGLRQLVQFSRVLQRRGYKLRVENIHRQVYTTLQELKLLREFEWLD